MKERPLTFLTLFVLLFTGVGALAGGFLLIIDPTGKAMGFSLKLLHGSPFSNYLIPGLLLFTVIDLGSLAAVFMMRKKMEIS